MNLTSMDSFLRTHMADYGLPATMVEEADSAIDSCLLLLQSASRSRTLLERRELFDLAIQLSSYCASLLKHGTRDPHVLLCGGVMTWWYCPNEFGLEFWSALHGVGRLNVLWPIVSAMRVQCASGVPTEGPLVAFLTERHLEAQAQRAITELPSGEGRGLKLWWAHILPLLASPDHVTRDMWP